MAQPRIIAFVFAMVLRCDGEMVPMMALTHVAPA
jgi:hypothetical protein